MLNTFTQRRPFFILFIGVVMLLSAGVIACSGDDDDGDDAAAPATAAPTEAADPEPTATPSGSGAAETPAGESESAEALPVGVAESDLGPYLTGPDGLTLYVFTVDAPDTSNCSGGCLDNWPPLLLMDGQSVEADDAATGTFGSIDTPSGEQVTYNGAPLYYFAPDEAPGDTNGHLVGNVWFVARPETASTSVVGVSGDSSYLVGPTGMSLYFFDNDTEGTSNCSGGCLDNWPALTVPESMDPTAVPAAGGTLDVITRDDDGTHQVTYNGLPLYYFAGDSLPGDTNGDGVGGVWTLATP